MKVALLEWVCGGGFAGYRLDSSLAHEGGAMLGTLAHDLSRAGHRVSAALDRQLMATDFGQRLRRWAEITVVGSEPEDELPESWSQIAAGCDVTLVVAPEIDGALAGATAALEALGIPLINCTSDFLHNASNKLNTARCLEAHRVAHPATCELINVDSKWLDLLGQNDLGRESQWLLKPADGAGSEGIRLLSYAEISLLVAGGRSEILKMPGMLVQPRIYGIPYSCSAIIDLNSVCHWLPLVSQDFEVSSQNEHGRHFGKYVGFSLPATGAEPPPRQLLQAVISALGPGALGWVGIDLVFDPIAETWTVIEVNPRLTTSFVGLCRAYMGNLALELLNAVHPKAIGKFQRFRPLVFRLDTPKQS